MTHILLPDNAERDLNFYLAMEEYVASRIGEGFFMWRVAPTVIFGRNQDMSSEVNTSYCTEQGIKMFRRKSGGGCVYSDWGNLMISCITPRTAVDTAFANYLESLCECLKGLGFDAVRSEHNDVMIGGSKVSGNACFAMSESTIVHGTLLYDTDFEAMQKAITPSQEKLQKHAVKSVRQRVANLVELGLDLSMEELQNRIVDYFVTDELTLSALQLCEIEQIAKSYCDPAFVLGKEA